MGGYLHASDIISGQEGKATAKIGENIETLFYVKSLEATLEKNKSEIHTLGHRGTQHKTTGWSGSGSMNLYYVSSVFRKLIADYAKTGKDTYFTLTIENSDPTSSIGKQTVVLYNCNLDSVTLAKLDVDNTELDEDVDFTFEDFEIIDSFQKPSNI